MSEPRQVMEPIRECVDGICKVIDYWIDEADLTLREITYILGEVDLMYLEEKEDNEQWRDSDGEEDCEA